MFHNWVDVIFVLAFLVSFFRGWRAGFLVSIFGAMGFIGGGLGGLYFGVHYLHHWSSGLSKFGLYLVVISVGSWLGEVICKKIASIFHSKILFGPFKWADSLLGAAFSLLRTAVMTLILAHLLLISSWGWAAHTIPSSQIFRGMDKYSPALIKEVSSKAGALK